MGYIVEILKGKVKGHSKQKYKDQHSNNRSPRRRGKIEIVEHLKIQQQKISQVRESFKTSKYKYRNLDKYDQ